MIFKKFYNESVQEDLLIKNYRGYTIDYDPHYLDRINERNGTEVISNHLITHAIDLYIKQRKNFIIGIGYHIHSKKYNRTNLILKDGLGKAILAKTFFDINKDKKRDLTDIGITVENIILTHIEYIEIE